MDMGHQSAGVGNNRNPLRTQIIKWARGNSAVGRGAGVVSVRWVVGSALVRSALVWSAARWMADGAQSRGWRGRAAGSVLVRWVPVRSLQDGILGGSLNSKAGIFLPVAL